MAVLYERIKGLCDDRGISGYKLCKDTGVSPNTLTELKADRRDGISAKNAAKIAAYFDVSVGYLLGNEEQKKEPAGQKASGLDETDYDKLSPENRRFIDDMIDKLLKSQSAE